MYGVCSTHGGGEKCSIWFVVLRQVRGFRVFENMVVKRMLESMTEDVTGGQPVRIMRSFIICYLYAIVG